MNPRKLAALLVLTTAAFVPATFVATTAQATEPVQCDAPAAGPLSLGRTATEANPAATRVGLCIQGQGYIEVGVDGTQLYVVASSDSNGYVGVSSFESSGSDSQPCGPAAPDGTEGGSGSNSGGCYGTNAVQVDLTALSGTVPLPVCGDDTGAYYNTSRNGCRADNEDVNEGIAKALATAACIAATPTDIVNCILANFP